MLQNLKSFLSGLVDGIIAFFVGAWNILIEAIQWVLKALAKVVELIVQALAKIWEAVTEWFGELIEAGLEKIKELLANLLTELNSALTTHVNDAVAGLETFAGPHAWIWNFVDTQAVVSGFILGLGILALAAVGKITINLVSAIIG